MAPTAQKQDTTKEGGEQYVVRFTHVNVWDPEYDAAEARKGRITRRLSRGDVVTADDLKHMDIKRLLDMGAIRVKTDDENASSDQEAPPAGELPPVPESQGATTPAAS